MASVNPASVNEAVQDRLRKCNLDRHRSINQAMVDQLLCQVLNHSGERIKYAAARTIGPIVSV